MSHPSADPASEDRIIRRGTNGDYHWLTISGDVYMDTLLHACPESVLHRHVAITSYDSGGYLPTPEERAIGWTSHHTVAYSPLITNISDLRFMRDGPESPGYDEWYVFPTDPPLLGQVYEGNYFEYQPTPQSILVFVNTHAFALHDPNPHMSGILDHFWTQLRRLRPESFIADGRDHLTLVSRLSSLLDSAAARLASPAPPPPA